MLKLLASFLTFVVALNCTGQSSNLQRRGVNELLFAVPHFSATITPFITQKATITTEAGSYTPTTTPVMGAEGGINYHLHFNKAYSFLIGFRVGVGGRNHHIIIPKEDFNPQLERDVVGNGRFTRTADLYFSIPLLIERRWQDKGDNHWNINAGVNVRHITENFWIYSSYYADVNRQSVNVEYFDLMVGNERKPWLNYNLGGGYAWRLKNNNFLRLNLLANYSATNMVQGRYTINVTGKESTVGRYTANLSFLGLSFNYILTGVNKINKKLRRREEEGL